MTKTSFYALMRHHSKTVAVLKTGYSDGTYYYYKSDISGRWWAIHPLCGQSITNGRTLTETARIAHNPAISERVHQAMEQHGDAMTKLYNIAIAELKTNN